MDINNLPADLKSKIKELHKALTKELPRQLGVEAVEHFTDNFRKGGFVNNGLQKWQDVKRRDPDSPWYGFEYKGDKRTYYTFSRSKKTGKTRKAASQKQLNFSPSATKRAVLTSKRNYLMNNFKALPRSQEVEIYNNAPHAKVHNEGGDFKVFNKHSATMPKRQFMGHSAELDAKAEKIIISHIDKIFD